jgi:CheY-like chemotaxis protein
MGLEDHHAAQEPSRIVVADDHPLFRFAIRQTLEVQPDLEVIAEAADGQEALELSRRLRPELILMDLRMPVMDGVATTQAIRRELPEIFVLILTALDESEGRPRAPYSRRRAKDAGRGEPAERKGGHEAAYELDERESQAGKRNRAEGRTPLPEGLLGRSGNRNSPAPLRLERWRSRCWWRKDLPTSR